MILLAQFVYWLQAGIWIPVDLWQIWTEVGAGRISLPSWRGVEKILDWILDLLICRPPDPYQLPGWNRSLVKVALNTLVNAETRSASWMHSLQICNVCLC